MFFRQSTLSWSRAVNTTVKLVLALCTLAASSAYAGNISLGQAAEFNTFLKTDMTINPASADTEGRVAMGGNLTIHGGYSFAHINASVTGAEVIVGGNVTKTSDGSLSVHGGTPASQGQLVYGGTLTGTLGAGTANRVTDTGINFTAAFDHLTKLSEQLAKSTTPNVTKTLDGNWLVFTPSVKNASNIYVFDITQQELNREIKIDNKNIAKDALIVFNVKNPANAASVDFKISQMDLGNHISTHKFINSQTQQSGIDKHILFNFYGVTNLNLNSSVYGSILAPTANINASTGVAWGHVIANSWKGNMQMNWAPLDVPKGSTPPVSAPSPIALLLLVPALFWFRQRHVSRTAQLAYAG